MSAVELHFGAATDVGRVRDHNEDAYLAEPPVFVVADGMGGHHGGDVASAIVVEEFARMAADGYDRSRAAHEVTETLRACQRRIEEYAAQHSASREDWYAGTTVVAALLVQDDEADKWLLVNLGDSRAYRVHGGELDQVSVDHSLVQELMDAGVITAEDAAVHPDRHVITRALGGPELPEPDFFLLPLPSAERVVLVSDGVTGMLDDVTIEGILAGATDPREAAERVVAAAVEAGGVDNATAVVVDVMGWSGGSPSYDGDQLRPSLEEKLGARPNQWEA